MTNNDILKRIRYVFNLSDSSVLKITKDGGKIISPSDLKAYYMNEEESGYKNCSNGILTAFLDGFIIYKRGFVPEKLPGNSTNQNKSVKVPDVPRNNDIFRKLKIALKLKDTDILDIFKQVDFKISKSEINAFFRRREHKNFRECGDQILRTFIQGLTKLYRDI